MSFTLGNLNPGSENNGKGCIHYYRIPDNDSISDLFLAGYFSQIKHLLRTGDQIQCFSQRENRSFMLNIDSASSTSGVSVSSAVKTGLAAGGRLVLLGDSLFAQGIEVGVVGVNGWQTTAQQRSMVNFFQALVGYPFDHSFSYSGSATPVPGYNVGISGDSTFEMLDRFDAQLVPKKPDVVMIIGGTNDIANNTTTNTIISNLKDLIDRSLGIGAKQVVLFSIPPRTAGGWSAGQEAIRLLVNSTMKAHLASFGEKTKFIDLDPVLLLNGTGIAANPDYLQSDGIHFSPYGAYRVAAGPMMSWWLGNGGARRVMRAVPADYAAGTTPYGNIIINPTFTGTGGSKGTGVTGTTPDNWHGARDFGVTSTAVASIVQAADWNGNVSNMMEMNISCLGTDTANRLFAFRPTANITTGVLGSTYYVGEVECEIVGFTGDNPLESVFIRVTDLEGDDTLVSTFGSKISTGDKWPTGTEFNGTKLLLRTPPLLCDGTTGMTLSLFTRVDGTKNGTVRVRWGTPVIKKILPPTWTL